MRNLLFILSFLFLAYSCSNDDIVTPTVPDDTGFVEVKIDVTKKESNIFEKLQFTIQTPRVDSLILNPFESLNIAACYDSLVWSIPELRGSCKVMTSSEYGYEMKTSWPFVFYKEGKFHTILHGYKNDKIILSDTIIINVANKRDILGYNWKDITKPEIDLHYIDVLGDKYTIHPRKRIYEGFPSLKVDFLSDWINIISDQEKKDFCEKEQEKFAYDYITDLYGEPKLSHTKDGATIVDIYKNTFKRGDISLAPRYIWETSTSRIVLLEIYGEQGEWNSYFIYAEPR